MNHTLLSLLAVVACAPVSQLAPTGAARALTTAPAPRAAVAVALEADEPLATPAADPHHGHHHAGPATVKDPVCGMTLDPAKAKGGSVTVGGQTFHFCSSSCRRQFEAADGGLR